MKLSSMLPKTFWRVSSSEPATWKFSLVAIHIAWCIVPMAGCTTKAPMRVWKAPQLVAQRPTRVAMAPLLGDSTIAIPLQEAMMGNRTAASQSIALLDPVRLEQETAVQLSSHQIERSDIGALSAAKRADSQYLLEGEIIRSDLEERPVTKKKKKLPPESLAVHWKVIDVASGTRIGETTIIVDRKVAEKRYPDLEWTGGTPANRVITAMARESWATLSPSIASEEVKLASAWVTPGATTIRKGNRYAKQGRWDLAEAEWQEAASLHPRSKAAWHNLALAAAAHEDFALARSRMKHADFWVPIVPDEPSMVWIERQQREYHRAFTLPPPAEGWTFPEPERKTPQEVPITQVHDIDDMPWWTALPFTKPPGWSWARWVTQPLTFR